MQVTIQDLVELEAYIESLVPRVPGLTVYKYLGEGVYFDEAIQSYFQNSYEGVTLFLGIFEGFDRGSIGQSFLEQYGQLIVLDRGDPTALPGADDTPLRVRNACTRLMLKLLGTIELDAEESRTVRGPKLNFRVEDDGKMVPIERPGNVNAYGCGLNFCVSIPVNSLKYS